MKLILLILAVSLPAQARSADSDAGTACQAVALDRPVTVKLPPRATVAQLVKLARTQLCEEWTAAPELEKRSLTLAIDGTVPGRQLRGMLLLAAESVGVRFQEGTGRLVDVRDVPAIESAAPAFGCPDFSKVLIERDPWTKDLKREAYEVLLDKALCLGSQVRLVPSFKNGVADGFKLFSIRPGSPVALLGFQNGDVIDAINDAPLHTAEEANRAFAAARPATVVRFSVRREGARRTITWNIAQ